MKIVTPKIFLNNGYTHIYSLAHKIYGSVRFAYLYEMRFALCHFQWNSWLNSCTESRFLPHPLLHTARLNEWKLLTKHFNRAFLRCTWNMTEYINKAIQHFHSIDIYSEISILFSSISFSFLQTHYIFLSLPTRRSLPHTRKTAYQN